MRKVILVLILLTVILSILMANAMPGYMKLRPLFAPDKIKIQLSRQAYSQVNIPEEMYAETSTFGINELDSALTEFGYSKIIRAHRKVSDTTWEKATGFDRWFIIIVPSNTDIPGAIKTLKQNKNIEQAIPEYYAYTQLVPNDTYFPNNWGHNNTAQLPAYSGSSHSGPGVGTIGFDSNAIAAWDDTQGLGSASTIIAIIDTGVDLTHPDLRLVAGYDFGDNDSNPQDDSADPGHGTACSGVAAGIGNNNLGVTGSGAGCSVMPLKIADSSGSLGFTAIENALTYAGDNNVDVASMSFGAEGGMAEGSSPSTDAALEYAYSHGVVLFAATANSNTSAIAYPSNHNKVISVGASSPTGQRKSDTSSDGEYWWGSNYGSNTQNASLAVDIMAPTILPATDIQGAGGYDSGNYSMWFNGTSCATPYAAGVAGLLISKNPALTPAEVRTALTTTAIDMTFDGGAGWDRYTGYGLVNAQGALASLIPGMPSCTITSPPNGTTVFPGTTVTVNVTATDSNGTITRVEFYLDGSGTPTFTDYFSPYSWIWNTIGATNGSHTIQAKAYDNESNMASSTINITLSDQVILGTGTSITSNNFISPINISFKSVHGQSVYTAAELNASGMTGPLNISQMGFYVATAPNLALPNFIIRMKHTTDTDVTNWQTQADMVTVYTNASYMPTPGGYEMLTFSTPFTWNGTDNIVIDTAFGLVANWSNTGTIQYTTMTNGYRAARDDNQDQTNIFTGGYNYSRRPNVKLTFQAIQSGALINVTPTTIAYGTVMINTTSVQPFTISNPGTATLSGNITTPSGYSVALAARQNDKPDDNTLVKTSLHNQERNTLAFSVPAGGSSNYNVTFAPTAVQAYNGNVTITHNATGGDRTVALTGAGGKPTIGLSATTFTANLAPGMTNNQTLTISNTGNLTLNYALTVSGSPAWLMVNGGSAYNNNIVSGGAAQNVTVGFNTAGMAPATYNATIVCASNDPSALSQNITVTLTVRNPLAITAPAVGASWPGGSLRNIVFGYSGAGTSVNMYYSFDDGAVWIAGGSLNVALGSNTYGWIVPNFPSATCRIKIVDSIAPNVEKISNLFSIVAPALPLLTVTAPNGGESWDLNSVHNITWTHNLLHPQVMLYYSLDNGSGWTYINTVNTSALSYSWTTPNTTSTQCRIRIVDAVDSYALDASNNTFSIVNPAPPTIPADASVAYNSSTGAAAISWSASTGNPTGYNVYFADNVGFAGAVLLAYVPAPLTSYTDTLVNTRPWGFYRIAAVRE